MSDQAPRKAVRFADDTTQQGFTQIPNAILRDSSLSAGARLTYALLSSFAWQSDDCWVGQHSLGEMLGVKERMVRNYLGELEDAALLKITRQGLKRPNLYTLFVAGQERQHSAGQDRQHSADEEDSVEKDPTTKRNGKKKKAGPERTVDRKRVTEAEFDLAAAVVSQFNSSAGTALSVDAHLTPIVMRIRERPGYTERQHRAIIEAVFAGEHWWTGPPTPKVIYGNAGIFEQSIELARAAQEQKKKLSPLEAMNADKARIRREQGLE